MQRYWNHALRQWQLAVLSRACQQRAEQARVTAFAAKLQGPHQLIDRKFEAPRTADQPVTGDTARAGAGIPGQIGQAVSAQINRPRQPHLIAQHTLRWRQYRAQPTPEPNYCRLSRSLLVDRLRRQLEHHRSLGLTARGGAARKTWANRE